MLRNGWFAAILLTSLIAYAYSPALHRVFVGDQVSYFAELQGQTSFASGLKHYDYAVSRQYWKGDDVLFRPLSLAWLALGNTLFSYHHVSWNVATVALHFLVTWFLFQLLLQIRSSNFALPIAALFAVMMPSLELVVWNHLGGYLLAYLFLVIGLRAFVGIVQSEELLSSSQIAGYVGAFTLAVFFHETMVPICLIAGVVLCVVWQRRRVLTLGRALTVFVPVLLFGSLYVFHVLRVERILFVDRVENARTFELGTVLAIPARSLFVIGRWFGDVLLPAAVTYQVPPFARLYSTLKFSWVTPWHLLNAVLAAVVLWFIWRAVSYSQVSHNLPLLIVLAGAVFARIGVISLGRGRTEVLATTYYRYLFCLLVLVLVYAVADLDNVRRWSAAGVWFPLLALIAFHVTGTHRVAREIGLANQKPSAFLSSIAEFVDAHKAEAGFSFAIRGAPVVVDPQFLLVEGYPDRANRPEREIPTSQILFARYYRVENPQYTLDWNGSELAVRR